MTKKLASTKTAKKPAKDTAIGKSASIKKAGIKPAKKSADGKSASAKSTAEANTFTEMYAGHNASVQAVAARLHALVREVLPEANEIIYGGVKVGIALYSIGMASNVICGIQVQEDSCLLYVHNVVGISHPDLRLEGRGGNNFHVRFTSLDEIKAEPVKWLIGEGRRLSKT